MAKQIEDTKTPDIFGEPKRRGRPATGNAMSNAERQRKFRAEKARRLESEARRTAEIDNYALVHRLERHMLDESTENAKQAWLMIGKRMGWL